MLDAVLTHLQTFNKAFGRSGCCFSVIAIPCGGSRCPGKSIISLRHSLPLLAWFFPPGEKQVVPLVSSGARPAFQLPDDLMQCNGIVRFQHNLFVLQAGRKAGPGHCLAAGNAVRRADSQCVTDVSIVVTPLGTARYRDRFKNFLL